MTELPPGWAMSSIGELTDTSLGKMLDAKQATGHHPTPYLRNVNARWGTFDLSDVATMDIRPVELERVLARAGDVIVCEGGEPGRAAVWRRAEPIALQKALHRVRTGPFVCPDFLALLLRHQAESGELSRLFTGTTIKHLPQEKLRMVRVPVPPIHEQERIVEAIEEAFSKLDAGEAALQTACQRLKRMRDAVLTAAVTGRLVPQDPTDTPASSVLSELGVSQVAGMHEVPSTWAWAALGGLLREPLRNGMSAVKADASKGLPTFSITAVTTGDFSSANIKHTAGDWSRAEELWAEAGDVFVQRSNTPQLVGTARLYRGAPRAAIFPDLLIRVRPVRQLRPEWLELVLTSPGCRAFLRSRARGLAGSMPKISQPVLDTLAVVVPPEDEQDRIVAKVDVQLSCITACERAVDTGLARSAALRRSVLKVAFEGRLVAQDPSDEPASILLERIRAERATSEPVTGRRRGRPA